MKISACTPASSRREPSAVSAATIPARVRSGTVEHLPCDEHPVRLERGRGAGQDISVLPCGRRHEVPGHRDTRLPVHPCGHRQPGLAGEELGHPGQRRVEAPAPGQGRLIPDQPPLSFRAAAPEVVSEAVQQAPGIGFLPASRQVLADLGGKAGEGYGTTAGTWRRRGGTSAQDRESPEEAGQDRPAVAGRWCHDTYCSPGGAPPQLTCKIKGVATIWRSAGCQRRATRVTHSGSSRDSGARSVTPWPATLKGAT